MNTRAEALASRFESASVSVEGFVTGLDEQALELNCPAEQCTIAALVGHVARVHLIGIEWIETLLSGRDLTGLTMTDIDRANETWFAVDADCVKWDAINRLRANRQTAAEFIRELHVADLDKADAFGPFNGARVSVQTLIEKVLIGDPLSHLASIQAAVAEPAPVGTAAGG